MKAGMRVKTIYGKIETIMVIQGCQVITYESARRGNWYHITKVFSI